MNSLTDAWQVLTLFLIPIGGGIPPGVLLAKQLGFDWPVMMILYLISDIILAFLFEPVMHFAIRFSKQSPFMTQFISTLKEATNKSIAHFGSQLGPLSLIIISFSSDPMTGRAVTAAAGHGFFTGWMIAITGDMFYFSVLMISTLWLNNILGDGTWTTIIILAFMFLIPYVVKKIRLKFKN